MAKLLFPLGLVAVLLNILLHTVSGASLSDLFIVHDGGSNGGCNAYYDQATGTGTLDNWLDESIYSITTAINYLSIDVYNDDIKVRRALYMFFHIPNRKNLIKGSDRANDLEKIAGNLKRVEDFFNYARNPEDGKPIYPMNGNRYLFCGSDFVVQQTEDTPARDWQGNVIYDGQGNQLTIGNMPGYNEEIVKEENNKVWWSGDYTPINAYYFSAKGADFCSGPLLGLTTTIKQVDQNLQQRTIESVVICGSAFTNGQPNTYRDGVALIKEGTTTLQTVLPKSATLLHETFHVIFGAGEAGFLEDTNEFYDIIQILESPTKTAMRNPESYVLLIAHLYYLFGQPDGNEGTSIDRNWDFVVKGSGGNRGLRAKTPGGKTA